MTALFEASYDTIAQLIGAPSRASIALYRNATEAINAVMYSMLTEFRDGDNVVTTMLEHNSNYVPWYGMCREILPRLGRRVECRLTRFDPLTACRTRPGSGSPGAMATWSAGHGACPAARSSTPAAATRSRSVASTAAPLPHHHEEDQGRRLKQWHRTGSARAPVTSRAFPAARAAGRAGRLVPIACA